MDKNKLVIVLGLVCIVSLIMALVNGVQLSHTRNDLSETKKLLSEKSHQETKKSQVKKTSVNLGETTSKDNAIDKVKKEETEYNTVVHNFFDSLFTYNDDTFNDRYKKASKYCNANVLQQIIGENSGHDAGGSFDTSTKKDIPKSVENNLKNGVESSMKLTDCQFYINVTDRELVTGVAKVTYHSTIDGSDSGDTTSWYLISIDWQTNKISKVSIAEELGG